MKATVTRQRYGKRFTSKVVATGVSSYGYMGGGGRWATLTVGGRVGDDNRERYMVMFDFETLDKINEVVAKYRKAD